MATDPWAAFNPQPVPTAPGPILGPPRPDPSPPTGFESDPSRPGALRPIPGGPDDPATNDNLDDATTTFYAQQVLAGAPMPAMGMGKVASQNRQKVMAKVAEIAGAKGLTGTDLAKQIAHYQAGRKQLGTLETQLGTTRQNEETALLNGQQFLDRSSELPLQTEYPALNSLTQFFQKNIPIPGHDTKVAMDAAWNTFVNEYAKVVSGSPSGAGTLSDSARHEAMSVLQGNYSLAQKKAVFDQMKADMANRMTAMKSGINEGYDALVNQPGYEVPDTTQDLSVGGQHQQQHIFIPGVTPPGGTDGGGSGGSGGDGPPGMSELSPDQQHAYSAFLAANPKPSGDQVGAFLTKLTGKPVVNGDDIAKAIAKGQGVSTTVENGAIRAKADEMMREGGGAGAAAVAGAADTVSMGLSDEVGAGINALGESLSGHGSFADNYSTDVGANRLYQQELRGEHPIAYTGGQVGGGLLLPVGKVSSALDAAKVGAGYGGAYGVGSGDNGVGSRIYGGALGAVVGAGAGAGGHAAANALAPYVAPVVERALPLSMRQGRGMAPEVADAAQAEGVDLIRPMVDPTSRGKFGALESAPGSQNVIRQGVDRARGQIEDRVAALGDGGTPLETDAAGERVQNAARQFIQRSKGVADTLYNRARSLAGDARFVPQQAIDSVDQSIAELSANPKTNAGEINFLNGLRDDLSTPGGKTVEELRQLRQSLRGRVNEQNLTATRAEGRAIDAMDATHADAAANLPAGAATAYRRADTFYRERMTHVDDVLDRFLGGNVQQGQARLSGEQAFQRLKNMMAPGGDARRLAGLMRDLEPNERQDIAATIAANLGRRSPDEPFSTDLLLSQANKLSPQARRTMFGQAGADSIDNLRLLSQKLKEGVGDFNRSKTANSMWRQMASGFVGSLTGLGGAAGLLEGGLSGGGTGAATGLIAGAAVKGGQMARNILSARAMVNPRVSRWLAEAADVSTPSQAEQAVRSLRLVISREPALAHELLPIHQFLDQRVTQLLAAEPGNDDQGGQ